MPVAVAGTFGPIHDGHRVLLEHALRFGERVIVGLTSDELASKTRSRPVAPYEERKRSLAAELESIDEWGRDVVIRKLTDPHEIVTEQSSIDALVVSPETVDELESINGIRRDRGFDPLTGIVAPYVLADDGERISSTRIVRGEIDEHGATID